VTCRSVWVRRVFGGPRTVLAEFVRHYKDSDRTAASYPALITLPPVSPASGYGAVPCPAA
jgi:hypothetical protein